MGVYMGKINFSKVEEALTSGMYKMNVDQLGKIAEVSQKMNEPALRKLAERTIQNAFRRNIENKATIYVLKRGSKKIKNDEFYKEFDLTHEGLLEMIQKWRELNLEDWEKLRKIKSKMLAAKEQHIKNNPDLGNEQIVNLTREEQKKARMNVPKTWLPL
jgi:hypothetical protein